jgi:hypothetical protein
MAFNLPAGVVRSFEDVQRNFDAIRKRLAPAAREDLVFVRGSFGGGGGSVLAGTGWAYVRNAVGVYTVTFQPAFSALPVIVITPNVTGGGPVAFRIGSAASTGFGVATYVSNTGAALDADIMFIAIGPA